MAESKSSVNYRNLIVPLAHIAESYSEIMDMLSASTGGATIVATRAVFETLGNLWHTPDTQWQSVRSRVCIGLVKDTKNFGNTSVSQGCAVRYFGANPDETIVAFLNCGTGGIKYQMYGNNRGLVTVLDEYKPKDGASPQEFLKNDGGLTDILRMAWHREKLKSEMAESHIPENCPVFAFVTGKIRAAWESNEEFQVTPEDSDETLTLNFNTIVTEFFGADPRIKPWNMSFFLTQKMEGELESLGTDSMYNNLTLANELPKSVQTVAVVGIGRGSVQLTWQSADRTRKYPMNTTPGMDDELGLSTLPWRLMPEMREKIEMISEFMSGYEQPVIALKSGCMLHLNTPAGKPLLDLLTSGSKKSQDVVVPDTVTFHE